MTVEFEQALRRLAGSAADRHTVHGYQCTVASVNTTARTCTLTDVTTGTLTGIPYIGLTPMVGAKVLYLTFDRVGFVMGGTGKWVSRQTLSAVSGLVTFTPPAGATDVRLVWSARSNDTGLATREMLLRVDGNIGNNYVSQMLDIASATGTGIPYGPGPFGRVGGLITDAHPSPWFSMGVLEIPYWSETQGLSWLARTGLDTFFETLYTGVYRVTGPYTSFSVLPGWGQFKVGSWFQAEATLP